MRRLWSGPSFGVLFTFLLLTGTQGRAVATDEAPPPAAAAFSAEDCKTCHENAVTKIETHAPRGRGAELRLLPRRTWPNT